MYPSTAERRAYIIGSLRARLADLSVPDWEEDELAELGPTLRSSVLEALHKRTDLIARLTFAEHQQTKEIDPCA